MKTSLWNPSLVCLLAAWPLLMVGGLYGETPKADQASEADVAEAARLVRLALESEVRGQSQQRDSLIQEALERLPEYAPARWHGGYVRFDDQWLKPGEASEQARRDSRLREYRLRRNALGGTIQEQIALARWCQANRLEAESRVHWLQVLQSQPNHEEALKSLGVQWYRGLLLTHDGVKEKKEQLRAADRAMEEWTPLVKSWRKAYESGDSAQRAAALSQLRSVTDLTAIPALERVLSVKGGSHDNPELSLELVAVLGKMTYQEATESLVRHAVFSPWEKVRAAAADQLKPRPLHSYVPMLLSGMSSPIEVACGIDVLPDGTVYRIHRLFREGPLAGESLVRVNYVPSRGVNPLGPTRPRVSPARVARNVAQVAETSMKINRRLASENAISGRTNGRIHCALSRATDVRVEPEPKCWWQWWADYNEVYRPKEKPVQETICATVGPSCFARGTRVWALGGPAPIETVRVGDRVLAQDANTGELAHKPVLATTIRPPSPMLRFWFGEEEVVATLGHPFWVVGQGWRMAKNLKAGDRIQGVGGSVAIDRVEEATSDEARNLVVADFHSYFAGSRPILVHDNTPREVTDAPLPGLASAEGSDFLETSSR